MKIDIKDFTFLIPVRFDTIIRLENMLMSIRYLLQNFETNILVIEAANYENGIVRKLLDKRVDYVFIEDKDEIFHKTKYVNILALNSNTQYIGIWDADVIIRKKQIFEAVVKLREGYEIAYPYDGEFYDTSEIIREFYFRERKINILTGNLSKMSMIYGNQMIGGAVFVNKKAFVEAGMENEKYYGWGSEDSDRHERWKIFGYNIYRSSGCLFHLTHPRGINSKIRSVEYGVNTRVEWLRTTRSSVEELKTNFSK